MSRSLMLYRYPEDPHGRYIEDSGQKIEECYLDDAIFNEIANLDPWAELEVFEDTTGEESNIITCLNNEKIPQIREKIESSFLKLIKQSNDKSDLAVNLNDTFIKFRNICNFYFLIWIKIEKFGTDDRAVIQLV